MLLPLIQLSADAISEDEKVFHAFVVAEKDKAEDGEELDFYIRANVNYDEPVYGLSFNLDIPEGMQFVEGSFTVNETAVKALGLTEYEFEENGSLPYYFYAAATEKSERSEMPGEGEIARFKCRVNDDAKGVFSVNTVNNTCVYLSNGRAERCEWKSNAAVVRVNVPDSEPLPPDRPKDPEEGIYHAYMGFADADWDVQCWDRKTVIKEGENTLTFKLPHDGSGSPARAEGVSMLVIDLLDCLYTVGYVSVTDIIVDGEELSFFSNRIIYGADDHSMEDNYRIEIFSYYGDTFDNSPIKQKDISFSDELTIKFVVCSDRIAEDDREVCGDIISGHDDEGAVPLEGCKVSVFNDNGSMLIPKVTGSRYNVSMPRGHYSLSFSRQDYVTRKFDDIDIGKTIPECLHCIELNTYGDVNGDTLVDVEDAVSVIMHTTGSQALPDRYKENVADCDFNGEVDIIDVVTIINQINGVSVIKKK